jgi:hypothetical protein
VVHWDVEVRNQADEPVAVYTILTLVRQFRGADLAQSDAQLDRALVSEAPAELSPTTRVARTEPGSAPVRVT